jgi:[histone H3]-lysine4/36 N-trimethyltransferase SMYD
VFVNAFVEEKNQKSSKEIVENFCRLKCNSFSILDEDMNEVGTGVYNNSSFINHDCYPNSVEFFF